MTPKAGIISAQVVSRGIPFESNESKKIARVWLFIETLTSLSWKSSNFKKAKLPNPQCSMWRHFLADIHMIIIALQKLFLRHDFIKGKDQKMGSRRRRQRGRPWWFRYCKKSAIKNCKNVPERNSTAMSWIERLYYSAFFRWESPHFMSEVLNWCMENYSKGKCQMRTFLSSAPSFSGKLLHN